MLAAGITPAYRFPPRLLAIHPWSDHQGFMQHTGSPASTAWPNADTAIFWPFTLPVPGTVTQLFWANGSSAGDNWDVGVFSEAGVLIVAAGTTVGSGASTLQFVNIADTLLARGRYYFGVTHSTTTANRVMASAPAAGLVQAWGQVEQAVCAPPFSSNANPATFAANTRALIPMSGLLIDYGTSV